MLIEISTDRHIDGRRSLIERIYAVIEASVGRYADRVSRVAVHLGDDEPGHGSDDVRCAIEVRLAGRGTSDVTHYASKTEDAVAGAARKLRQVVEAASGHLAAPAS